MVTHSFTLARAKLHQDIRPKGLYRQNFIDASAGGAVVQVKHTASATETHLPASSGPKGAALGGTPPGKRGPGCGIGWVGSKSNKKDV